MNKCLLIVIACLSFFSSHAQTIGKKDVTPMHLFFQKNADSTLIIESLYTNYDPSSYLLIAKEGNNLNAYSYIASDSVKYLYNTVPPLSDKSRSLIWAKKAEFLHTPADLNVFFKPFAVSGSKLQEKWMEIQKLKIWQLEDDFAYGRRCPDKDFSATLDGSPYVFYLITKQEIKRMEYFYPKEYEELCPGNKNRQAVIKLQSLIKSVFLK